MAKYRIQGETLKDIADAIRTKKNSTDPIAVSDFATEINSIPSGDETTYNTIHIGSTAPTTDIGVDGDIYIVRSTTT